MQPLVGLKFTQRDFVGRVVAEARSGSVHDTDGDPADQDLRSTMDGPELVEHNGFENMGAARWLGGGYPDPGQEGWWRDPGTAG